MMVLPLTTGIYQRLVAALPVLPLLDSWEGTCSCYGPGWKRPS